MKKPLLLIIFFLITITIYASHIVGGEVFYTYLGPGSNPGTSQYLVSLRLFRDCNVPCGNGTNVACLPQTALIEVYDAAFPYSSAQKLQLPLYSTKSISLTTYPACISAKPSVCYEVKTYTAAVTLTDNADGYILAYQNCCRASSINVVSNANTISGVPGATYTANIPGTKILPGGHNTSAVFNLRDTTLVCFQSNFTVDFSATDADGDSLSYAFASAYDGGDFISAEDAQYPGPPPYGIVTYDLNNGFSGVLPLGKDVHIDPATGIISGTSPSQPGHYVVNVIVYEWRHDTLIATHRKDFIMRVEACNIPQATLQPSYLTCDGFNLFFENESTSPLINSYYWDFGDAKNAADTSTSPTPNYYFSDSGTYTVTLITNRGQQCSDTATTIAKVYPGFIPDFSIGGRCILLPYKFTDQTKSKYGIVNSWHWDFGDLSTTTDTSVLQNPQYFYSTSQTANVSLIVGNSKGCIDTVTKSLVVNDKPPITLPFRDTLICVKDTLQLHASGTAPTATFTWSPVQNINNASIPDPVVYPNTTTTYKVTINDSGCVNTDSVIVNVIPFVTLDLGADTTICLTDAVQIFPATNALYFSWSPSSGVSDTTAKDPFITPTANTQYKLTATVGNCSATDNIRINVVPYPKVVSGPDTSICYGKTVNLSANTTAPYFSWTPASTLTRANTLTPTAGPTSTTSYIITVTDVQGCPKPVSDTTVVTVIPPVHAFAGNDTAIVVNQPLQLNATGGTYYSWTPATGMNDPNIPNPVITLSTPYDSIKYHLTVTTPEGCSGQDDIKIKVFKSQPDIFVPSAFTPNGDGLNDIIRPVVVGVKEFKFFSIYNRLGQLLYTTYTLNKGWDGTIAGLKQPSGAYVYVTQAIDYTGKLLTKKGTVVLIR